MLRAFGRRAVGPCARDRRGIAAPTRYRDCRRLDCESDADFIHHSRNLPGIGQNARAFQRGVWREIPARAAGSRRPAPSALALATQLPDRSQRALTMHILPEHNSYSLIWMCLGVIVVPTTLLWTLFLIAHHT